MDANTTTAPAHRDRDESAVADLDLMLQSDSVLIADFELSVVEATEARLAAAGRLMAAIKEDPSLAGVLVEWIAMAGE